MAREPGPVKGGKTVIAFVEDPTGYKWELIERQPPIPEPVAQVWGAQAWHAHDRSMTCDVPCVRCSSRLRTVYT